MSSNTAEFILRFVDQVTGPLDRVTRGFAANAFRMNQVTKSFRHFQTGMTEITDGAVKLESKMAELQSITQVTDAQMKVIEKNARQTAIAFGTDATDAAGAYIDILSRLSPEIVNNQEALKGMGQNVALLSKLMNNDQTAAVETLTTAMLQYNVSLKDPIKAQQQMFTMLNMLKAGDIVGSAQVNQVAATLKVAGTEAFNAGVKFSEFNAITQVLGKGALYGSEAGTKLRNILARLGEGQLMPPERLKVLQMAGVNMDILSNKTLPLADRLSELSKITNVNGAVTKFFGEENSAAASIIFRNIPLMNEWTKTIENNKTAAVDGAAVIMNTTAEKSARITAFFKDLGISFGQLASGALPAIMLLSQSMILYGQLAPVVGTAFKIIKGGIVGMWNGLVQLIPVIWTSIVSLGQMAIAWITESAANWLANIAMYANPIGFIVLALVGLGIAIALVIKYWDEIKQACIDFANWVFENAKYLSPIYWLIKLMDMMFPGLMDKLTGWWEDIKKWFEGVVKWFKEIWDKISGFFSDVAEGAKSAFKGADIGNMFKGADLDKLMGGNKDLTLQNNQTLNNISGGGSKPTTINISIGKFQDKVELHTANFKEGIEDFEKILTDMLLRVVAQTNNL